MESPACDEFGFSLLDLSSRQLRRKKLREFSSRNQWLAQFPTVEAALAGLGASDGGLCRLVTAHGIYGPYRAALYERIADHVMGHDAAALQAARTASYVELLARSATELDINTIRQIELDVPRTFCEQRDFARASAERAAAGQQSDGSRTTLMLAAESTATAASVQQAGAGSIHDSLRRVLRAFCVAHPALGYLQSMNFVGAFCLLVHGRDSAAGEAAAFRTLELLCAYLFRGYYTSNMLLLRADCAVFRGLLQARLPALHAHMEGAGGGLDISSLFLPRWLLCMFLNVFPAEIVARVWDCMLVQAASARDGPDAAPRTLLETGLAVLRVCGDDLLQARSFVDAAEVLKSSVRVSDAAELMGLTALPACSLLPPLSEAAAAASHGDSEANNPLLALRLQFGGAEFAEFQAANAPAAPCKGGAAVAAAASPRVARGSEGGGSGADAAYSPVAAASSAGRKRRLAEMQAAAAAPPLPPAAAAAVSAAVSPSPLAHKALLRMRRRLSLEGLPGGAAGSPKVAVKGPAPATASLAAAAAAARSASGDALEEERFASPVPAAAAVAAGGGGRGASGMAAATPAGCRTPPVDIDSCVDRLFSPLPASPQRLLQQRGTAAALLSPAASSLASPPLVGSGSKPGKALRRSSLLQHAAAAAAAAPASAAAVAAALEEEEGEERPVSPASRPQGKSPTPLQMRSVAAPAALLGTKAASAGAASAQAPPPPLALSSSVAAALNPATAICAASARKRRVASAAAMAHAAAAAAAAGSVAGGAPAASTPFKAWGMGVAGLLAPSPAVSAAASAAAAAAGRPSGRKRAAPPSYETHYNEYDDDAEDVPLPVQGTVGGPATAAGCSFGQPQASAPSSARKAELPHAASAHGSASRKGGGGSRLRHVAFDSAAASAFAELDAAAAPPSSKRPRLAAAEGEEAVQPASGDNDDVIRHPLEQQLLPPRSSSSSAAGTPSSRIGGQRSSRHRTSAGLENRADAEEEEDDEDEDEDDGAEGQDVLGVGLLPPPLQRLHRGSATAAAQAARLGSSRTPGKSPGSAPRAACAASLQLSLMSPRHHGPARTAVALQPLAVLRTTGADKQ